MMEHVMDETIRDGGIKAMNPEGIVRNVKRSVNIWGALGGATILVLTLLTSLDAVLRYAFNMPIIWGYDISTYFMGACVFFGIAYTELQEGHVNVSLFFDMLSLKGRAVANFVLRLIMLFVSGIMVWSCCVRTVSSIKNGCATIGVVSIPRWPLDIILLLSMIMFSLLLVVKLYGYLREAKPDAD